MSRLPSSSVTQTRCEPIPSLPPSPSEEDLGGATVWMSGDEEDITKSQENLVYNRRKGKATARASVTDPEHVDDEEDLRVAQYPPSTEEEEESRRVTENLKMWGTQERHRRKFSRESALSSAHSSVIGNVSIFRRASSSLSNSLGNDDKASERASNFHAALRQISEDALPLNHLNSTSTSTAGTKPQMPYASPSSSFSSRHSALVSSKTSRRYHSMPSTAENPFEPSGSTESPFDDNYSVFTPTANASSEAENQQEAGLSAPRPIDLSSTKASQRLLMMPDATSPIAQSPRGITPPLQYRSSDLAVSESNILDDHMDTDSEHRWWTDWLCGCREGRDRGGDYQAGRTNPFE